MSRKQALILIVLLVIFAGALYLRLSVTLGHGLPLGRDGPYHLFHVGYLLDHYPSNPFLSSPPVFFHFAAGVCTILSAFGVSLMTSFNIATALASGLVALTTFLMVRRLTKNDATALAAAFLSAFVPGSFRMMGELQKNAFGVALAPLPVLFLWRGLESKRKLDFVVAGIALGVVGLTHELAFGTLVIAYICYLAFLLAYRRRIPWRELKAAIIIAIPVALICGYFYIGKLGTIGGMAGEGQAATLVAQGELQQPPGGQGPEGVLHVLYNDYIGQLLLVLAAIGAGIAAYRRKPADFFLLAWGMSALIMAQTWVAYDNWRFVIMLATPMVLLAAVGLVEGVGALLWRAGKNLQALLGKGRLRSHRVVTMAGCAVFLCLLLFVVVQQVRACHTFVWEEGEIRQLQPTITMEEYNALQEFHQQFGDVYVFGSGERFIYWPDAVGLKGTIQGGEVITHLSMLGGPSGGQINASELAAEWYMGQQQVGENIYALASTEEHERTQILENEQLFKLIFSRPSLRAYALSEKFSLLGNHLPSGPKEGDFALAAEQPLPGNQQLPGGQQGGQQQAQEEEPLTLKILLAPVYVIPGAAKFIVGIPLTVLLWVFLPCLAWEAIRRITSGEKLEKLRKGIIVGGVVVLALAVASVVKGIEMPMGPGLGGDWVKESGVRVSNGVPMCTIVLPDNTYRMYYNSGPDPDHLSIFSAISSDGLAWTKESGVMIENGFCPAIIQLDNGSYRMIYDLQEGQPPNAHLWFVSAISTDGLIWEKESGIRLESEGAPDYGAISVPEIIELPDGRYRMYYVGDMFNKGPEENQNTVRCAISSDNGWTWERETISGIPAQRMDPDVIVLSDGTYRMFYTVAPPGREEEGGIYSAISSDGLTWTKEEGARLAGGIYDPDVVELPDGTYRMYYCEPPNILSAKSPELGPGPGPGEAPPGFEFVEGDSESWILKSEETEIGEGVLSPSWFRFDYLSGPPSLLRCGQFGSLVDARNDSGPLDENVVNYVDGAPGGYTFAFGEGAASVSINLSLSNCPPTGHVIYKYEKIQI